MGDTDRQRSHPTNLWFWSNNMTHCCESAPGGWVTRTDILIRTSIILFLGRYAEIRGIKNQITRDKGDRVKIILMIRRIFWVKFYCFYAGKYSLKAMC